jgi:anti-sigma factor RsiW
MEHLEEDLSSYVSNELKESERQKVETHLSICPTCAEKLQQLQKLNAFIDQSTSLHPGPEFVKDVLVRVDREKRTIRFRMRRNVAIFVAAAVIAFFVFLISLQKLGPPSPVMVRHPRVPVHQPGTSVQSPAVKQQAGIVQDAELIAHLDELENMELIQQLDDLDQFDAAMMMAENEVTK